MTTARRRLIRLASPAANAYRNPATRGSSGINRRHQDILYKEARDNLSAFRTLTRLDAWIRCAITDHAGTPHAATLAEFIRDNESLLDQEREKLPSARGRSATPVRLSSDYFTDPTTESCRRTVWSALAGSGDCAERVPTQNHRLEIP